MLLWVLLALMTGAVVTAVLWPLSKPSADPTLDGDVDFYKAQIAEIDRDRARGLIAEPEAEAARIESGRRLLRATASLRTSADATSEPALRRRRAASAMALCVVPIVGLGLYGGYGSPELQGQGTAVAASPESADAQVRFEAALRRVEEHLAANPTDARGWDVVAPIYLRVGRYDDARGAFASARRTGGDNAARLLGEAEARIALGQGAISPEARSLLEGVVLREPTSLSARYYLALAREQDGDRAGARAAYGALIAEASGDAPWLPLIRARIARLDQPAGVPTIPTVSATPEIEAMVGGLDERLKASGGSEAEWARLVRSLVVLGRRDEASERLAQAKSALAGDPGAPARLDRLAGDLGLRIAGAR